MPAGNRRDARIVLLGLLCLGAWIAPVHAASGGATTIGSSFGVSYVKPEGDEGQTLIAVPNSGFFNLSPGFRFGAVSSGREFEFGIDVGVLYATGTGSSFHDIMLGLDVVTATSPRNDTSPYFMLEGGMHNAEFFGTFTQPYLGLGLGVRHVVSSDHGAVKFGVGFRRFFENQSDGVPSLSVIDFKLAFDLWFNR